LGVSRKLSFPANHSDFPSDFAFEIAAQSRRLSSILTLTIQDFVPLFIEVGDSLPEGRNTGRFAA
jgi:hypothetical protein